MNSKHTPTPISDRLRAAANYAEYNYGKTSPITQACQAGDADAFMAATPHVTEYSDARLCSIQNAIICARIDAKAEGGAACISFPLLCMLDMRCNGRIIRSPSTDMQGEK